MDARPRMNASLCRANGEWKLRQARARVRGMHTSRSKYRTNSAGLRLDLVYRGRTSPFARFTGRVDTVLGTRIEMARNSKRVASTAADASSKSSESVREYFMTVPDLYELKSASAVTTRSINAVE